MSDATELWRRDGRYWVCQSTTSPVTGIEGLGKAP